MTTNTNELSAHSKHEVYAKMFLAALNVLTSEQYFYSANEDIDVAINGITMRAHTGNNGAIRINLFNDTRYTSFIIWPESSAYNNYHMFCYSLYHFYHG